MGDVSSTLSRSLYHCSQAIYQGVTISNLERSSSMLILKVSIMTNFQSYVSRIDFLAACRNRPYLGRDEVCIVHRAEFSSSANAELDPNLFYLGPAI